MDSFSVSSHEIKKKTNVLQIQHKALGKLTPNLTFSLLKVQCIVMPGVVSRIILALLLTVQQDGQNPNTLINAQKCTLAFCPAQMCMQKFDGQITWIMVLNTGSQLHTSERPVHDWTEA